MRPGLLLLLLLPALAWGENTPSKAQLAQLKDRISELSAAQNRELRKRDSVQADLREAELRISRLSREQRNLEQQAGEARQRLAKLEKEQAQLAREKQTQLDWLAKPSAPVIRPAARNASNCC